MHKFKSIGKLKYAVIALTIAGCMGLVESDAEAGPKKGWLGVVVEEMTPSMRDDMKLGNRSGLLINEVVDDSPADEAGLMEDDVILKFNGNTVDRIEPFVDMVRVLAPKTTVKILLLRDGKEETIEVKIGKRKRSRGHRFALSGGPHMEWFSDRAQLGAQVHEIDKNLAGYFNGASEGAVLILSVIEDGPAAEAGLQAGDVITKIDDEAVGSFEDLSEALSYYDDGDKATISYLRKGKAATATATLKSHFELGSDHSKIFRKRHRVVRPPRPEIAPDGDDVFEFFLDKKGRSKRQI